MSGVSLRESTMEPWDDEVCEMRGAVLLDTSAQKIHDLDCEGLLRLQTRLGYGETYGVWQTPREWLPPSSRRALGGRVIRIRDRLSRAGVPAAQLEDALRCATQYAVLLALIPAGLGKGLGKNIKPSMIRQIVYHRLPIIIAASIKNATRPKTTAELMCGCSESDLLNIRSLEIRRQLSNELARVLSLYKRRLWPAAPAWAPVQWNRALIGVRGDVDPPVPKIATKGHQPLPDEYVAEAGWRVLWIVQDLAPTLMDVALKFVEVAKRISFEDTEVARATVVGKRRVGFRAVLAEHRWVHRNGTPIVRPPFSFSRGSTERSRFGTWPPTNPDAISVMLRLVQTAHMWIVLLSAGPRVSELLSLQPGCLQSSADGTPYVTGLTYKLAEAAEGRSRDWPLSDRAVDALRQQEKLREIVQQLGVLYSSAWSEPSAHRTSLWSRIWSKNDVAGEVNKLLVSLTQRLDLPQNPGGKPLTTHRFRKTVARLVALSLTGAPKILMDLFGHKSVEMTIYYILADADIRAEVRQVVEDVAIMRAVSAIQTIDECGGAAASTLRRVVERERIRTGGDLAADDVRQLAEVLTLNGQSWELVRPGVICTKLPGSTGPCTKQIGHPEPSRCRTSCEHRLEEAMLKDDVEECLKTSVSIYEQEQQCNNEIQMEFWAGQILANLRRFDSIRERWSSNSTVRSVLQRTAHVT